MLLFTLVCRSVHFLVTHTQMCVCSAGAWTMGFVPPPLSLQPRHECWIISAVGLCEDTRLSAWSMCRAKPVRHVPYCVMFVLSVSHLFVCAFLCPSFDKCTEFLLFGDAGQRHQSYCLARPGRVSFLWKMPEGDLGSGYRNLAYSLTQACI